MSLIAMAVWSNNEPRISYTKRTIESLFSTVDLKKHRLIISDNGSCQEMQEYFQELLGMKKQETDYSMFPKNTNLEIIFNGSNLGTAMAINKVIQLRKPGEFVLKVDDDNEWHQKGWLDRMEEAIIREPNIGILGLKRGDLEQSPSHPEAYWRTQLMMLPHVKGQQFIVVELSHDIMGTCTLLNHKLLDKVGYYFQQGTYGFDDSDISFRSRKAGFINAFLSNVYIDNIDEGSAVASNHEYTQWKKDIAGVNIGAYSKRIQEYESGQRSIYFNPFQ